jgi:hypothetical protein
MNDDDVMKKSETAMNRDPREFKIGHFSGGSFVLDTTRVFTWFSTEKELIDYICECEPLIHHLETTDAKAFSEKVYQVMEPDIELSDANLCKVNALGSDFLCIDWWGSFDDLVSGKSNFAKELRSYFHDDESDESIAIDELDDFVEFIQHYGF